MKVNLPVTQNEVFLDPARPIVTKTDLKGQITYANRAFIDISGFTENELIGVSHNIVRHPDMPPEAFADLWATLKAGRPWSGLVKNRNKAGDFYWVEAYVSPITENGETIGYMSVRNAPKREDVAAAEALYRDVRDKRRTLPATPKGPGRYSLPLSKKLRSAYWGAACLMLLIALLPDSQSTLRWALAGAGATFGLVMGWTLPQSFRVSIRALRRGLMRISEGNFTQPVRVRKQTAGSLGEALVSVESTRISLRALMADVLAAAGDTQTHAQNLRQRMAAIWAAEIPAVVLGDFNVIPRDCDVWSPQAMADDALMQPESRDAYLRLLNDGWTDAIATHNPRGGVWTYWDYQASAWPRDHGFRIDHALLSPECADRLTAAGVDRAYRGREKASDHAPVWVELRD